MRRDTETVTHLMIIMMMIMIIINDRDAPGDEPEDEPEVEVVDLPHNVAPPLGRLGGGVVPAGGGRGGELQAEPDEPDHQAHHQAPKCAGLIRPE